jgi:hypothetical protein
MNEAGAVGAAMQGLDAAIASARGISGAALQRSPLSTALAPRGRQVAERHGYLIYVAAERVPNAMYRAWAEIMKDGKRVERSGLVGPRFTDAEAAEHYAFEWAAQWIDRECAMQAAAYAAPQVRAPQAYGAPMHTQMHKPVYTSDVSAAHSPYTAPPARPMAAGMRHVPESVAAHHGAPLHGPLNAFRGPLRRYTSEPAAAAVGSAVNGGMTSANASANAASGAVAAPGAATATPANPAAADRAERYPSYTELISHAG